MSNGTLIILMGIPGCGKSTYAQTLLEQNKDYEYVSRDEVRYEYVKDQEHYFDREGEVYREYCNRITMYLQRGKTVIADATHLNESSRRKLMNTIGVKPDKVYLIFIDTPFETCVERNNQREGIRKVPMQHMYRMKRTVKLPLAGKEPYIDDVFVVRNMGEPEK